MTPILEFRQVTQDFSRFGIGKRSGSSSFRAVEDVTLAIAPGTVVGLVGESGSGKTTLARLAVGLIRPTSGEVLFEGRSLAAMSRKEHFEFRSAAQMVFQNPYAAFNPRRRIGASLSVGLDVHRIAEGRTARRAYLAELLEQVGMRVDALDRFPHEFSGGQRQRLVIARALSVKPRLVVADEPVSALDVSIQAQVLNLLRQLQEEAGFTLLLISHDLRIVHHLSSRVVVMYTGRVVEEGATPELFKVPLHPYTKSLLDAIPTVRRAHQDASSASKTTWEQVAPPGACPYMPRCGYARDECRSNPPLLEHQPSHEAACWRSDEIALEKPLALRQATLKTT
jgi:oligopeptide/dipeptide ABC transporter ATP-binding protein